MQVRGPAAGPAGGAVALGWRLLRGEVGPARATVDRALPESRARHACPSGRPLAVAEIYSGCVVIPFADLEAARRTDRKFEGKRQARMGSAGILRRNGF